MRWGRLSGVACRLPVGGCAALLVLPIAPVALTYLASSGPTTFRVSIGADERQGDDESWGPAAVGSHARIVAFTSLASNLVAGDTNRRSDVFVRLRGRGTTSRVSVGPHGRQANGASDDPAMSADGRYVAFSSHASNLVAGDTNGRADAFVRDRVRRTTERVSVSTGGRQGDRPSTVDAITPDGRYVVFSSAATTLVPGDTNRRFDVFVRDRTSGVTSRASVSSAAAQGNRGSYNADISATGRYIVFTSWSSTLVAGDTNGDSDVFLRDVASGTTTMVSAGTGGEAADSSSDSARLSADGHRVSFLSDAHNIVPGDTNGSTDVFVRDLAAGGTTRVSVGPGGRQASGMSTSADISANGRYVVFSTLATNLTQRPTRHVQDFVRDLARGRTTLVSRGADGQVAAGDCFQPSIAPGGWYVAFSSRADNLVRGDAGGHADMFVRRWHG